MGILKWWKGSSVRPSDTEISQALDRLVPPPTPPADNELDEIWRREGPGTQVRARHILFRPPCGATASENKRLLRHAAEIQTRAANGEDFAELASAFTMEPGGQARAGDLGRFGRGRMVKEFEDAAFTLQPGEISGVVASPFGYHLIKVEERMEPVLEDKAVFRDAVVRRERGRAVGEYLDTLKHRASVQVEHGAETLLREMARRPDHTPGFWAARRPLVRFRGGKLTVLEMAEVLRHARSSELEQIANASSDRLNGFLVDQVSRKLIWAEAVRSHSKTRASAGWWNGWRSGLIEAAPGTRLLWFADFFYSEKSLEEVLQPTILDMRVGYNEAYMQGRIAKARWIRVRGTWEFACTAASLTITSIGGMAVALWKLFRGN